MSTKINSSYKIQRIRYLKTALSEMSFALSQRLSLAQFFVNYRDELSRLEKKSSSVPLSSSAFEKVRSPNKREFFGFANWYSEHSILFLLFLGSFLIVLAAATFVAFNWENFEGITKFLFLLIFNLVFIITGLYIYFKHTSLRLGGVTFCTIGALLIPLNGVAYYNFIAYEQGSLGIIWLSTSLISLLFYLGFYKIFDSRFFKYISCIASLAFAEAFVYLGNLHGDYYVLGAIITSYILMLFSRVEREAGLKTESAFLISSQMLLPLSLLFGLTSAMMSGALFTLVSAIAILLASTFYFVTYWTYKLNFALYAGISLFIVSIGMFAQSLFGDGLFSLYLMHAAGCFFVVLPYTILPLVHQFIQSDFMSINRGIDSTVLKTLSSAVLMTLIPFYFLIVVGKTSFLTSLQNVDILVFSLLLFCITVVAYLSSKIRGLIVWGEFLISYILYQLIFDVFKLPNPQILYSASLLFVSMFNYLIIYYSERLIDSYEYIKTLKDSIVYPTRPVISLLSVFFSIGSIVFSLKDYGYSSIVLLSLSLVYLYRAHDEESSFFSLVSPILAFGSFISLLLKFNAQGEIVPFYFAIIACVFAVPEFVMRGYKVFSNFTNVTLTLVSAFLILISFNNYGNYTNDMTSLVSFYIVTALLGLVSFKRNSVSLKYIASVFCMYLFFYHLEISGVKERLWYNIPLGLYFLAVGFTENYRGKRYGYVFDYLGMIWLFFTAFGGLFDFYNSYVYALVLGLEGLILVIYGLSRNVKRIFYGGAIFIFFTVLSQTYEYIFSIQRWILLSFVGLLILSLALYLMYKKSEK